MKKLKFLFLSFICLMMTINFVSCNNNEDDNGLSDNRLIGQWVGYFDGDDALLEFKSNGKVSIMFDYTDGGYPFTTSYSVSGETLRIEDLDDEYTLGTYSINGKVLTYTYSFYDYEDNEPTSQTQTNTFTKL